MTSRPHPHSDDWSDYDERSDDEPDKVQVVRWYAHPPSRFSGILLGVALAGAFALGAFAGSNTTRAGHWVRSRLPGGPYKVREETRH
jgi:hypothetical protein